jgi:hypothetical protein
MVAKCSREETKRAARRIPAVERFAEAPEWILNLSRSGNAYVRTDNASFTFFRQRIV